MSRMRVINLGLPKSGTTSLGHALKLAGLKIADFRIRHRQTRNEKLHDAFVGELIYKGYFETGDPLALMEEFDGFSEISCLQERRSLWPQTDWGVIEAIRSHHPGARFLATRRDPFAMSQSMLGWSDMGVHRVPRYTIPGLPQGFGETSRQRMQWISSHYAHLRQLFRNDSDFLEVDVSSPIARSEVSTFLGIDLPWWGRARSTRGKVAS